MKNKYQASLSCIKYYCGHYNKAVETAISNLQESIKKYDELYQELKKMQDEIDYYKHEYYSCLDLLEERNS